MGVIMPSTEGARIYTHEINQDWIQIPKTFAIYHAIIMNTSCSSNIKLDGYTATMRLNSNPFQVLPATDVPGLCILPKQEILKNHQMHFLLF